MTITCYSIVSRNERQQKTLDFFFLFKISNGIQKCRTRQLNSSGNQFNNVISSIQFSGKIKRSLVYVTNLFPIYVWLTHWLPCKEAAEGREWVWAPCNGPVGSSELGNALLSWYLGPPHPTSFPWGSPGDRSNGVVLGLPEPKPHYLRGCLSSASWRGYFLGGWAVLFCSHSCKFDPRNCLLLEHDLMKVHI